MKKGSLYSSYITAVILLFLLAACANRQMQNAPHALENTRWTLVGLAGNPMMLAPDQLAPNITLDSKNHRVSGFSGCNQLMGGYQLQGDNLSFGQFAATRIDCFNNNILESQFRRALGATQSWQKSKTGDLEFLDKTGKVLARFRP